MKRSILMSIRKEYTDMIRAGRKTCEYRTNLPAELRVKTMKILLYETDRRSAQDGGSSGIRRTTSITFRKMRRNTSGNTS